MPKKEDFDVIIIGSGVSGLVCGCYLQKAGLKVAILEAREEAGGGRMAAEFMRPGYLAQSCIWMDFDPVMPYQLDLELDRYGYQDQEMFAEWPVGHLFPDGTCLTINGFNPLLTVEKLRRFSERDAKKLLEVMQYLAQPYEDGMSIGNKLVELVYLDDYTWENFDLFINLIGPLFPFKDPYEITDLNVFEALDLLFNDDQVKLLWARLAIANGCYPFHTGGSAFFALPIPMVAQHPKHSVHSIAHVYIRCFRALGGKLFNSCPVKKIIVAEGEAKGVVLDDHAAFPGKEITAKKIVSNLNPRLTYTELVGEEHVGKKIIQKLKTNWKAEAVECTISYAVKKRPRFAAEKFDPDIVHTTMGTFGGHQTFIELARSFAERLAGRVPGSPTHTYCLPHEDDPTQNREGNCVASAWMQLPYTLYGRGGPEVWDNKDFRREIIGICTDTWETYCPGFKENVLDVWMSSPLDLLRLNPSYLRGCDYGGSYGAHQMFFANRMDFEGFSRGGVITPIKNLYHAGGLGASASAGSNGYRVANCIAEEMGIRNQPWWTHRMFEYFVNKYIKKTYVPLKPTSILDKE